MDKQYQWAAALTLESGGYDSEPITIEENGTVLFSGTVRNEELPKTFGLPWNTTSATTGSATYTYTYLDSDNSDNNNATKVYLTVRDEWTASINNRNYLSITVNTTLVSATRAVIGSPSNLNRHIWLRRESGSSDISPFPLIDNASTSHTIASNVSLGSYTFTLPPGQDAQRATIYWRSTTVGYENVPIPNPYTDIIGAGVHFKNILPADYRPGKTWNGSAWMSHNRASGAANIRGGSSNWIEMRTIGDGTMTNNPPYMRHNDGWRDMRLIGQE